MILFSLQYKGHEAAQNFDESGNAALHLVISGEYADAASALAILKCIPVTVSISNKDGLLPIEVRDLFTLENAYNHSHEEYFNIFPYQFRLHA